MDELPGLPGVVRTLTLPVLRHVRTIREWHAGLLTETEIAALAGTRPRAPPPRRQICCPRSTAPNSPAPTACW
ncbi:hypothetical protein GCM10011428_57950 [Streptomyces violaceus]|uniref:hypothetical protein n=1 Tax=Streptomyces violaceus TaxID=1936 RepID=UPI0031E689FA